MFWNLLEIRDIDKLLERRISVLTSNDSQHDGAFRMFRHGDAIGACALFQLFGEPFDGFGTHFRAQITIEWCWRATLLHVT